MVKKKTNRRKEKKEHIYFISMQMGHKNPLVQAADMQNSRKRRRKIGKGEAMPALPSLYLQSYYAVKPAT